MKIAIAHEWLETYAGSERVVEQMVNLYPDAALFSLVDFLDPHERSFIQYKSAVTSFIQKLPQARQRFRQYLPLMPLAVEQFNFSDYDVIISSHHAVTKGIISRADQLHISYVHTPIRYAWELQWQYLAQAGLQSGLKGGLARLILHYLRLWDISTVNRVDRFAANSRYVARRIWKTYRRQAVVIYPPVALQKFRIDRPRDDFYLAVTRFVPYKRVDLTVQAFSLLGLPLVIIGEGPSRDRLQAEAGDNIQFLGYQPDTVVIDYMERCKAFVFPTEEDFGITPVEAQAAGAPVIAYGRGGATETIQADTTGRFFQPQTVEALVAAVQQFEETPITTSPAQIRQQVERFSEAQFRHTFQAFVDKTWCQFQQGQSWD